MKTERTLFKHISGTDGLQLSAVRTEPADASLVCGCALIVHGMCEHKGRYEAFTDYLAEHGFITVAFDLRGHGESVRDPKDLGYFYEGGYKALIEDAREMISELKAYAGKRSGREDLPCVMIAHSMGTLIARCFLRKYDDEIDRLCLLGCPSKRGGMLPGLWLSKALAAIKGGKSRSSLVDHIVGDAFEKRFKEEHTPYSWTNSDPEEVRIYLEDPLCGYSFTLNGYVNLIAMTMETYRDGGYAMKNAALPIRFFSGSDDPCAVSKEKLGDAIKLLRKQGYKDTRGKIYPGMRHEILRERGKAEVYADILRFLTGTDG